jgi:hypothetical protein
MVDVQSSVSLALSLLFYLVPAAGGPVSSLAGDWSERSMLASWEATVAERMDSAPNPYQDYMSDLPGSLREAQGTGVAPLPESASERRWFEMEDSGDMMGIKLSDLMRAGLQVEFAGYAEDPKQSRRMINMRYDPYHPAYLLTTAGLQMRF